MFCSVCGGYGKYTDESGIEVICQCAYNKSPIVLDMNKNNENLKSSIDEELYSLGIIPKWFIGEKWDIDRIKERVHDIAIKIGYEVVNFDRYVNVLMEILDGVKSDNLRRSYFIGAPNGFGKEEFTYELFRILYRKGYKVVPYISLYELYLLKQDFDNIYRVRREVIDDKEYYYEPFKVLDLKYLWVDYLYAKLLVVFTTNMDNAYIEMDLLKLLLDIRGKRGLATIAFTEYPLNAYLSNEKINKYTLNEMINYDDRDYLDKLIYISTYFITSTKF